MTPRTSDSSNGAGGAQRPRADLQTARDGDQTALDIDQTSL